MKNPKIPGWVGLVLQILGSVAFIVQVILLNYGINFDVQPLVDFIGTALGSGFISISGVLVVLGAYLSGKSIPVWGEGERPDWATFLLSNMAGVVAILTGILAYLGINLDIKPIVDFLGNFLASGTLGVSGILTLIGAYFGSKQFPLFPPVEEG